MAKFCYLPIMCANITECRINNEIKMINPPNPMVDVFGEMFSTKYFGADDSSSMDSLDLMKWLMS